MAATVIEALRRFLPAHLREHRRAMNAAQRRAVWAINHCRTAEMGGHLHTCDHCKKREFHFHSCNHRSCPQCGKNNTAEWIERELRKRVGAPYFMVTFTLPEELRTLFFTPQAKEIYQLFFAAASSALTDCLAHPRWLGAKQSGFTMVLHTWNQRLHFHPHIHSIVPGAGIAADGKVVTVKNQNFLIPQPALRTVYRARFRDRLAALRKTHTLPDIDPAVWQKDWGVDLQPFGSGENIIKYLGRYVCRTAIGDSRIISVTDTHVSFRGPAAWALQRVFFEDWHYASGAAASKNVSGRLNGLAFGQNGARIDQPEGEQRIVKATPAQINAADTGERQRGGG